MNGFRDVAQMIELIDKSLHLPRLLLERTGVPHDVIDEVYQEIAVEGTVTRHVFDRLAPYLPSNEKTRGLMLHTIGDDGTDQWDKDRTVLVFDETTWEELGTLDDADLVSPDVFDWMPYPNPFLMFPRPVVLPSGRPGTQHRVHGTYVYGLRPSETGSPFVRPERPDMLRVCSTDDPRKVGLLLRFAGFMTDADGRPGMHRAIWDPSVEVADSVFTTCPVRFPRPVMSFGEIAELVRRLFVVWDNPDDSLPLDDSSRNVDEGIELMRMGLAAVLYLCCSNADLEIRQAPTRAKGKKSKGAKRSDTAERAPKIVMAGFRLGAELRQWRLEHERQQRSGEKTGKKRKPHRRRAHMHRFRYGPQRSLLSQPRFLPSTWINARDRDGHVVTIKPVTSA